MIQDNHRLLLTSHQGQYKRKMQDYHSKPRGKHFFRPQPVCLSVICLSRFLMVFCYFMPEFPGHGHSGHSGKELSPSQMPLLHAPAPGAPAWNGGPSVVVTGWRHRCRRLRPRHVWVGRLQRGGPRQGLRPHVASACAVVPPAFTFKTQRQRQNHAELLDDDQGA